MNRNRRLALGLCAALVLASMAAWASVPAAQRDVGIGDAPENAPPLASGLTPALDPRAIDKAVRKVGAWELARSQKYFNGEWTFAVLYAGYMAAAKELPDSKYQQAMLAMGNKLGWMFTPVPAGAENVADYHAVGQTYLDLYAVYRRPEMLRGVRQPFDAQMQRKDDPAHPVWWWSDALFMGPPTWARLYRATGNITYLNYMDREWWITSNLLYRPAYHLYSRDASYLDRKEANGKPVFWSRGNGWVMAGLARTLEEMPAKYPDRKKYVRQFREMAAAVAPLQGADGLWSADLLDAKAYPNPETSGTALFVYALAWGVDHGLLDRRQYMPVVARGWKGLLAHVYADGRLGAVQPVGSAPVAFHLAASYVYGVGGFLMAGAELHAMAEREDRLRVNLPDASLR